MNRIQSCEFHEMAMEILGMEKMCANDAICHQQLNRL